MYCVYWPRPARDITPSNVLLLDYHRPVYFMPVSRSRRVNGQRSFVQRKIVQRHVYNEHLYNGRLKRGHLHSCATNWTDEKGTLVQPDIVQWMQNWKKTTVVPQDICTTHDFVKKKKKKKSLYKGCVQATFISVRVYKCPFFNFSLYECPVVQPSGFTCVRCTTVHCTKVLLYTRCTTDFTTTVGCCTRVRCTVMRAPFHESAHWKRSRTWRLHLKMLLMFPGDKSTNFSR